MPARCSPPSSKSTAGPRSGNVFEQVFHPDEGKRRWHTLDDRRGQILPLYEKRPAQRAESAQRRLVLFGDFPGPEK